MNKQFSVRHEEIKQAEIEKRAQIQVNFENHLKTITEQIEEDRVKLQCQNEEWTEKSEEPKMWENEIVKENAMLQKKYEALMQEIEEKSKLIDNAIENKSSTNEELEKKIELDIEQQEKVVEEQIEIYKTQTEAKNKERDELNKILKDYKSKYGEFEKATKKTRDYYKTFEKELKQLEAQKKSLQQTRQKQTENA